MDGIIFNTQRFSVHDGDGIRTTVFFKGCNLRCFWCHNPESLEVYPQIGIYTNKCIGCGKCLELCPNHCHTVVDGVKTYKKENCQKCGLCVDNCYAGAICMWGKSYKVEEVFDIIMKDKQFYDESGGGVTCSGGEPLLQIDFLYELFTMCKEKNINTAIETALNVTFESIEKILPVCDCMYIDIKCLSEDLHKKGTGVTNKRIQENLLKLNQYTNKKRIRIPLVPSFNDTAEEFVKIGEFIKQLKNVEYVEIMPFHKAGNNKYHSMGIDYEAETFTAPAKENVNYFYDILKNIGLNTFA